jgi:dienelactone hydrolase
MNARRLVCCIGSALLVSAAALPGAAQGAPSERVVDITAPDGLMLKGTLFVAPTPGPGVLLLHQCDEQRKVWEPLGAQLARSGVTALSIDYRGYGESGGRPHEQLSPAELAAMSSEKWPADIDAAFAFLARQPGVDTTRMAAAGGSCGVQAAVYVAQHHSNVKALALLAGGTNRMRREYLASASAPPIFTAAAADDKYADFVSIMGWHAALSRSAQSRMAQYRDGGHAAIVFRAHPDLADSIARWFAVVLKARSGALPHTNGVPMSRATLTVLNEIDRPGGAVAVRKRLAAARVKKPDTQFFQEYFVNQLGYEHLQQMKDPQGALAIMRLNVQAYPASPNAMDSLGDIYLATGDKAAALESARATLRLLEKDTADNAARKKDIRTAAEEKVKQLSGG